MKSRFNLLFLIITVLALMISCKEKKMAETQEVVVADSTSVTLFAKQLVLSVQNGNPDFFNQAFDKEYIRKAISENSIVYSSLDTDFGYSFFEKSFKYGNKALSAIENGGDVHFMSYYYEDQKHHIIINFYRDYALNIYDFIVDTVDNQLKIKDGFIYDLSTTLINEIKYSILFDVLNITNPEGATSIFIQVNQILEEGRSWEALLLLQENRELLEEYPFYHYYYLQAMHDANLKDYSLFLDEMEKEGFDHRSVLLHKMHYYCELGKTDEAASVIEELISFTGDAPIYLLFFGKAYQHAGKYEEALYCYQNAETGMAQIWDLWYGKLECYAKLKLSEDFYRTLQSGETLYGMTSGELVEFAEKSFGDFMKAYPPKDPAMKNTIL